MTTEEKRPHIPPAVASKVRAIAKRFIAEKLEGKGAPLARKIGVSQPAMSRFLHGGGIRLENARAICRVTGTLPQDVGLDLEHQGGMRSRFANLETALLFDPGKWHPATVAAARAGQWEDDVTAKEWYARLDSLDAVLRHTRVSSRPKRPPS